jgi:superfamily II DNA/RNA helicase
MSRNNVNMMICLISNARDLTPLLNLIRIDTAKNLLAIPKTIIFYDGIEGGQRIAAALRSNINPELASSYNRRVLVQIYFGTVDEPKKKQILSDLISGVCRIVICTDAFGLRVNIGDIQWVIQWSIDEKASIQMKIQLISARSRSLRSHNGLGELLVGHSFSDAFSFLYLRQFWRLS